MLKRRTGTLKDRKLKQLFQESEHDICIDAERKKKTLHFLSVEISRKKALLYDKKIIIKNQLIYMDKTSLFGSIAGSFIVMALIYLFSELGWDNHEVIALNSIFSAFLSVLSLAGISNIFSSNIAEVGESCYFNVKQMVAFQMLYHGIVSLTVLLIVTIWVSSQWEVAFLQVGLYVVVPYVFTQCCCLFSFLTKTGRQSPYVIFIVGIFVCIVFATVAMSPQIYSASAIVIWVTAFIVGVTMLSIQIRFLFCEIGKGEILCAN